MRGENHTGMCMIDALIEPPPADAPGVTTGIVPISRPMPRSRPGSSPAAAPLSVSHPLSASQRVAGPEARGARAARWAAQCESGTLPLTQCESGARGDPTPNGARGEMGAPLSGRSLQSARSPSPPRSPCGKGGGAAAQRGTAVSRLAPRL